MPAREQLRVRLTREGWYYLFVLSFIVGGAAVCHVNLLIILGGMMLAPLLINWRLSLATMRGVSIRARPIQPVHAAQPLVVEFELANHRRWLAGWMLVVEDRWKLHDPTQPRSRWQWLIDWLPDWAEPWKFGGVTRAIHFTPSLPPGQTTRVHYALHVPRRGLYTTPRFWLRSCYPLGLVEAVLTVRQPREAVVLPRLGHLSGEWTHRIAATLVGEGDHRLRQRASEGDFFAVRPWQSGDSTRWIHWRTTARAARPMVRQFEREPSPIVALILDPYLPQPATKGELARLEAAISFLATALADLAQRDVAQVAVLVASADPQCWIGSPSPVFLDEVYERLARLAGTADDHREAIAAVLRDEVSSSACVLVISSRPGSGDEPSAGEATLPETAVPESSPLADQHTICVASAEFSSLYALE
jgi:hypothetical protein